LNPPGASPPWKRQKENKKNLVRRDCIS